MEEKIKILFEEASKGHCNIELYKELIYEGSYLVKYAVENNRLYDLKFILTPQKYDDGVMRILFDPFSDGIWGTLNSYLYNETAGIKELMDSLYDIDYDKLFQIKIKDSHARFISGMGHSIRSEKKVIYLSEPACLKPMLKLYELNIDTWANDTEGVMEDGDFYLDKKSVCGINIYYSRLDEENKKIIDRLKQEGYVNSGISNDDIVFINVSCNREETIGEVSDRLLAIVSQLKIQDVKYYQLNEQVVKELVLELRKSTYRHKTLPYDLLVKELIKYYETFSPEEYPEINEIIQNLKDDVYDEISLNSCFRTMEEFRKQVIKNMLSSVSLEDCLQELSEDGYYIDRKNNLIFDDEIQYLKHLKYLTITQLQNESNNNIDNHIEESNSSSNGHNRASE